MKCAAWKHDCQMFLFDDKWRVGLVTETKTEGKTKSDKQKEKPKSDRLFS